MDTKSQRRIQRLIKRVNNYTLSPTTPPPLYALAKQSLAPEMKMFDAHFHLFTWYQTTEGLENAIAAMQKYKVNGALIVGTPLIKSCISHEKMASESIIDKSDDTVAYSDPSPLYMYQVTDLNVQQSITKTRIPNGLCIRAGACGFELSDARTKDLIAAQTNHHMVSAIGEIMLCYEDITNLQCSLDDNPNKCRATGTMQLLQHCKDTSMPFVFVCDASSSSSKTYEKGFEYIEDIACMIRSYPSVQFVWVSAGYNPKATWKEYTHVLDEMLARHPNLYISVTTKLLSAYPNFIDVKKICRQHPLQIVVGTTCRGYFTDKYSQQVEQLFTFFHSFDCRDDILWNNAHKLYVSQGNPVPVDYTRVSEITTSFKTYQCDNLEPTSPTPLAVRRCKALAFVEKATLPEHTVIDSHFHLLDLTHRSCGTDKIIEAMDASGVEAAVLLGMPCCTKASAMLRDTPVCHLNANSSMYYYSYCDQMVADAWLAMKPPTRCRFAPFMGAFDPTDVNAIDHVKRMYHKYPHMWCGVGKLLFRNNLSHTLQGREISRINHDSMMPIYRFCIKHNLPVLAHHNVDIVGATPSDDENFAYVGEVEEVLTKFPRLVLVWCHCGASRQVGNPKTQHIMIQQMLEKYHNLYVDISWVVWEDIICFQNGGFPHKHWVDLIETHHTRFMIGSNCVGHVSCGSSGHNILYPDIVKYASLLNSLTPQARQAVARGNAHRLYFEKAFERAKKYPVADAHYMVEMIDSNHGGFVTDNKTKF